MLGVRHYLGNFDAWWHRGATPSLRWQVYFYVHAVSTVLLSGFLLLDLRHIYPENWTAGQGLVLHGLVIGALVIVTWPAALLSLIGPFLSVRLLWLARHGGPSFFGLAICDSGLSIFLHIVLMVCT
jgi:hypothetical protein